jgi:hypothetical protein
LADAPAPGPVEIGDMGDGHTEFLVLAARAPSNGRGSIEAGSWWSPLSDDRAGSEERAGDLAKLERGTVATRYAAIPSWYRLSPPWEGASSAYAAIPSWCVSAVSVDWWLGENLRPAPSDGAGQEKP